MPGPCFGDVPELLLPETVDVHRCPDQTLGADRSGSARDLPPVPPSFLVVMEFGDRPQVDCQFAVHRVHHHRGEGGVAQKVVWPRLFWNFPVDSQRALAHSEDVGGTSEIVEKGIDGVRSHV